MLALLALFGIGSALASPPTVGDFAKYKVSVQLKDGSTEIQELTYQLTAYSRATSQGKVAYALQIISGPSQGQSYKGDFEIRIDDPEIAVKTCSQREGTIVEIPVVGKTMSACHIKNAPDSQNWFTNVPFGIAKSNSVDPNENPALQELVSYRFGN